MTRLLFTSIATSILIATVPASADQLDELVFRGEVSVSATAPDPPSTSGVFVFTVVPRTAPDGTLVELSYIMQTFIQLPRAEMAIGYSIREGEPGADGPIAIDTFFSADSPIGLPAGFRTIQATTTVRDPAGLAAFQRIMDNPNDFHADIRTVSAPDGLFQSTRLRLRTTDRFMAILDPIEGVNAPAAATIRYFTQRAPDGSLFTGVISVEILGRSLNADDSSPGPAYNITGVRVHRGGPGETGPVLFDIPPQGFFSPEDGFFGATLSTAVQANGDVQSYEDALAASPTSGLYLEVDSADGTRRAQLLPTETIEVNVGLSSAGIDALPALPGPAQGTTGRSPFASVLIRVFATRDDAGQISSADIRTVTLFDFSPGPVDLQGVRIHRGGPGEVGPQVFNLYFSNQRPIASFGGYELMLGNERVGPFSSDTLLQNVRDFLADPENHYGYLEAVDGRAVRGQLSEMLLSSPVLGEGGIINAAEAVHGVGPIAPAAPRGLTSIFGLNLADLGASSQLDAEGKLPKTAAGTGVWIGEEPARILFRSPNQLNVQIPDLAPGSYIVQVKTPGGLSNQLPLEVTETAPGILVMTHADFSLITAENPLRSGETFIIWATGLGASSPAVGAGELAPAGAVPVAPVSVTFNADSQTVAAVALSPGFAGLEQIAVTAGQVQAGSVDVRVTSGSYTSNAVNAPTAP